MDLPESTIFVLTDHLAGERNPSSLRGWAAELIEAGADQAAIIDAAIVEDHEWMAVPGLVAGVLGSLGFGSDEASAARLLRRLLVERLANPSIAPEDTIKLGRKLAYVLIYASPPQCDFQDFIDLDDELGIMTHTPAEPELLRRGLRDWALAYLRGEIDGPLKRARAEYQRERS